MNPTIPLRASTTENIPALTGIRAYAAIWVVLLHLQFSIGVMPHVQLGNLVGHGFWAVDIFFVLSGFILSLIYAQRFERGFNRGVYWSYLVARFARIYPLHIAALGVLVACFLLRATHAGMSSFKDGFDLRHLALNILLLHGWGYASRLSWNYPSWSISSEWFAYFLLLPLYARGLRRAPLPIVVLLAALAWAALYYVVHRIGEMIGHQIEGLPLLRIAAEFMLGYCLYRMHSVRLLPLVADALAVLGAAGIVALCFAPDSAEWVLGPAVVSLVLGLTQPGPLGRAIFANRMAVYWGERSYSIYMLHAVVQIVCNLVLLHFGLQQLTAPAGWLLFVAQVGMVLLASNYGYKWLELPLRRRVRTLLDRPQPVPRASVVPPGAQEQTL